jgi:uncharacterized protein (DUF983 family)
MKPMLAPKPMWRLGGCPKCLHGDLYVEDSTESCLQCGYTRELHHLKPQPPTATGRLHAEGTHRKEVIDG